MRFAAWTLPPILDPANSESAVLTLQRYFSISKGGDQPLFSGSRFERLAGGEQKEVAADRFTAVDLVAVTTLSVDVPGQAALRILGDTDPGFAHDLSDLLAQVPADLELIDASDKHLDTGNRLWKMLRSNRGVGPTKTSKLLARKRPHLFPVLDSVVTRELSHGNRTDFYVTLREHLRNDDRALWRHLRDVREHAGVGSDISVIRCFDILVWMAGSGRLISS